MKLIIDFDHTIFDMASMHEALDEAITDLGIPSEQYRAAYNKETNWKVFSVPGFANRLEKMTEISSKEITKAYHRVGDIADLFVYEDVHQGLEQLKEHGHEVFLLSWGDTEWQMRKIQSSGIRDHFKDVLTVTQLKAEFLQNWCADACDVVVVDDKPAELKAIKERHPKFHLIRMRRENGKYSDQETPEGVHEAVDMKGVLSLVKQLSK